MDVEPAAAVAPEGDDLLGTDIVARQRQRHDEGLSFEREKQLSAVGVVIEVPQQHAHGIGTGVVPARARGVGRPAEDIVAADGVVLRAQHLPVPGAAKDAFDGAALVAGARIHRAPALCRPLHDFDLEIVGIIDQATVTLERPVVRPHQRHLMPRQGAGHVRRQVIDRGAGLPASRRFAIHARSYRWRPRTARPRASGRFRASTRCGAVSALPCRFARSRRVLAERRRRWFPRPRLRDRGRARRFRRR